MPPLPIWPSSLYLPRRKPLCLPASSLSACQRVTSAGLDQQLGQAVLVVERGFAVLGGSLLEKGRQAAPRPPGRCDAPARAACWRSPSSCGVRNWTRTVEPTGHVDRGRRVLPLMLTPTLPKRDKMRCRPLLSVPCLGHPCRSHPQIGHQRATDKSFRCMHRW